jgi:hypothetical protein
MLTPPIALKTDPLKNHYYIITVIISSMLIWIPFKIIYPYPFITIDSYYYIGAAYENANAGSWPIGYSKFIRLVGFISHSHLLLVTIQYLILQASFLYFFLTIRRLFNLSKLAINLLFAFLFFNPIFIIGSNHVMSDILFCSLAICWICQLLWILKQPKLYMLITQAVLLTTIFTIRYTALYFPLFSVIVLLISCQPAWRKCLGILLTFAILLSFIRFTRIEMEKVGGIRQFSSAAGWKQASNALYMYVHVFKKDNKPVPEKFKILHQLTRNYFKGPHTPVDLYHIDQEFTTGSFYVAAYESPLMRYLRIKKGENADVFEFKNIAPFGPLFNAYGTYLITRHPLAYINYVVLPDIVSYLIPFPEIYGTPNDLYYLWSNHLGKMAKSWFNLSSVSIPESSIRNRGIILSPYPMLFTIIHLIFVITFLIFITFKYNKDLDKYSQYAYILLATICIGNFIFTVLSASSVLRFQFTFIILEFTISLISINQIIAGKNNSNLSVP